MNEKQKIMENKILEYIDAVVGIDPGKNGGIAIWTLDGTIRTVKMPKVLSDIRPLLRQLKEHSRRMIVFIEKLQMRHDDISDNPGKAFRVQAMLEDFITIKNYMEVDGIPFVQIHPMAWQTTLRIRKQGEEKKERKNRYKEVAGHLYPGHRMTLWSADAVLIMHAGRIKLYRQPEWVVANLPDKARQILESMYKTAQE